MNQHAFDAGFNAGVLFSTIVAVLVALAVWSAM